MPSRPEDFPPPPPFKKIIIEEDSWHPLDHRIGGHRCRTFQGGHSVAAARLHWRYEWEFGTWRDMTLKWPHKLLCLLGRHKYQTWFRGRPPVFHGRFCYWCLKVDPDVITEERIT